MPAKPTRKARTLRLPADLDTLIDSAASDRGTSANALITEAVRDWLIAEQYLTPNRSIPMGLIYDVMYYRPTGKQLADFDRGTRTIGPITGAYACARNTNGDGHVRWFAPADKGGHEVPREQLPEALRKL